MEIDAPTPTFTSLNSQKSPDSGTKTSPIPAEWFREFDAAARRSLETRIKYGFVKTYKPIMDDAEYRSWESTADYRRWCEENLPSWLGYGRV